jgi:hypothetical protein
LKPSSYAFNITALIMFLFWIPSLEALGIELSYATLASFLFLTGAGVISAAVFKHKALWYVPAFSLIGLIISLLATIDSELSLDSKLLVYGGVSCFIILGIVLRYFWKAKVTWLPVQTRRATVSFNYIYPIVGAFFAFGGSLDLPNYPFILTLAAVLFTVYFTLDHIIKGDKAIINMLRVWIEVICVALAFDISYGLVTNESDTLRKNIILLTIFISSLIQGLISIILFAIKNDEESHSRERFVFAAAIVGFSICSLIGTFGSDSLLAYNSASDTLGTIITLAAQLSIIVFALLGLILDRNSLLLIIAALGLCDLTLLNLEETPVLACIILSAAAVIFNVTYVVVRKVEAKHALNASIISAIICAIFALFIGEQESIAYIPVLGIGLSMAIQGFIFKKAGLRIAGIYTSLLGIIIAWQDIRSNFGVSRPSLFIARNDYPTWVYAIDAFACLLPPAAAFLLSIFDKKSTKTLKDGSQVDTMSPNFVIGAVLGIFNAIAIMPELNHTLTFLNFTLALAMLIGILVWSAAKKWLGFEIASLIAILILVLEHASDNIWITLIIAGMGIIGIVVFISYKNYKKFDGKPSANTLPETKAIPTVETKVEPEATKEEATEAKVKEKTV